MQGTSRPESVSTKLLRIAELSSKASDMVWTTLAHVIDLEWLQEAYRRTRKDGATGVDGQTAEEYAEKLQDNLRSLLDRFKSGTYKAPPVRRVHIPKGDGKRTRPIGIPAFEDKVLQRAVSMVMGAVYEQDFLDCSYGFRPKRSAHQALETLWKSLMDMGGGWLIDLDIKAYFDTIDHGHLRDFLDSRVRDGVLRRAIDKWLKAGVMEAGMVTRPIEGSPQGGVISPILANIYLHEVLDIWFETAVKPRMRGGATMFRYADDAVLVFTREDDARRVMDVLPKRLGKYGLTLHPEKTKLINFQKPPSRLGSRSNIDGSRPGTFEFLGFRHYWGRSRRGRWTVTRKTASSRLSRALKATSYWCRRNLHRPVAEQHQNLTVKLKGHYQYYGITGNFKALARFRRGVERIWRHWLDRRSNRAQMNWDIFKKLLQRYPLPKPRVVHSYYHRSAKL